MSRLTNMGAPGATPQGSSRILRGAGAALLAAVLAACSTLPGEIPSVLPPETAVQHDASVPGTLVRAKARWVPVDFSELPGWNTDGLTDWWPAMRQSCTRAQGAWVRVCQQALSTQFVNNQSLQQWVETNFRPYRIENHQGDATGLLTGYYEPQLQASRTQTSIHRYPVHRPPTDLSSRQPYWTRQQIETVPAAQAALKGREIAWLADPMDVLVLQIQAQAD